MAARGRGAGLAAVLVGVAAVGVSACDQGGAPGGGPAGVAAPASALEGGSVAAPASAPAAVASAAPAAASASAAPAAGADAAPSLAGTWEGGFEAKKATVTVPAKVKDKGWGKDDGTAAVGKGSVEMTIAPDGALRGRMRGALGDAALQGHADGGLVRASVVPDDPTGARAMTGVLVGVAKADGIHAEIHVAGPDALIVREAATDLRRK